MAHTKLQKLQAERFRIKALLKRMQEGQRRDLAAEERVFAQLEAINAAIRATDSRTPIPIEERLVCGDGVCQQQVMEQKCTLSPKWLLPLGFSHHVTKVIILVSMIFITAKPLGYLVEQWNCVVAGD